VLKTISLQYVKLPRKQRRYLKCVLFVHFCLIATLTLLIECNLDSVSPFRSFEPSRCPILLQSSKIIGRTKSIKIKNQKKNI